LPRLACDLRIGPSNPGTVTGSPRPLRHDPKGPARQSNYS